LADEDIDELYPIAVALVELLPRRDRAGGERSGETAEAQHNGAAA
jgi:hypothetical protein